MKKQRREFLKIMTLGTAGVTLGGMVFGNVYDRGFLHVPGDLNLLLSRLNMDGRGLERVRSFTGDNHAAAKELLKYYRERQSVNHPVDRSEKSGSLGNCATESDIEAAENALRHIFIGQGAYPPYFVGDDIDWGFRPVPDNEWVWQLNRMRFWNSMGRAYWHTGEEKYAEGWAYQLRARRWMALATR